MNILMVSLDFIPTVGGITAHVYELSKALIKNGCNVSVITRAIQGKSDQEVIDGINVHRIKLNTIGTFYGYKINKAIKNLLKNSSYDVIHIHGLRPLEFYNIKDTPLAYTNHTSGYLKRIKKGGYRIFVLKKLFKKPKLFLAPSKELLKTPFQIDALKCYIPNGVVADKFKRDKQKREDIRKKLGIKQSDIVAIITRRMVWKNGVKYLALSTKYIKNQNLKLLLIGDGEEFDEVKTILQENFKDRFFMLGAKTHQEIVEFYSVADISILPSLMEATSISGLEAMAAGLPIVGTNVGGIPELVREGATGYLCNPRDPKDLAKKIDKLLKSDYKKMGQNAKNLVKKEFDWDVIAKKTMKEYRKIL